MTDRVYPSSKPKGTTTATGAPTTNPRTFPPTKSQLYNPNRHPYRPQPTTHRQHRRRRSCLCKCCFWSIVILTLIILLAALSGAIAYLLYHPHRPTFSISSLKITQFNLTTAADDSTHLTTKLNLTLSSKNPNKKVIFFYDPIAITAQTNHQVQIANGSFQSFTSNPNNITIVHSQLYSSSLVLDADSATTLRSDLKKKTRLPLKILLDTQVRVRMDSLKSKRVGIRIICEGVKAGIPKGKSSPSVATISDPKCKVDLRIKIWKWTF